MIDLTNTEHALAIKSIPRLLAAFDSTGESSYLKEKLCYGIDGLPLSSIYFGDGYIEAIKDEKELVVDYVHHRGSNRFIAIPAYDHMTSKITTLQFIYDSGTVELINQHGVHVTRTFSQGDKRFLSGARKQSSYHLIGDRISFDDANNLIYLCEGYATAASVHLATGAPVVVAFDAINMEHVADILFDCCYSKQIIIAADNDIGKSRNTGLEVAEKIAGKYGCQFILPHFDSQSL
jgi:hypothetical protein